MPAGMPKIDVVFLIDANGILQVTAKELRTGKAAGIEVKPTYGLSEADVERMVEESFAYAEADVGARLLIETRNEADTVITHVERALRQGGDLVSAHERREIRAALEALKRARATDDRELIHEATTATNRATEHLAEVMMDSALRGALGSKRAAEIMAGGVEGGGNPPSLPRNRDGDVQGHVPADERHRGRGPGQVPAPGGRPPGLASGHRARQQHRAAAQLRRQVRLHDLSCHREGGGGEPV